MEKSQIENLREELEEKQLKIQMENLTKEPAMRKMRETVSHDNHTVTFSTSVAMQKAFASKILGQLIQITESDWVTQSAFLQINVAGDETRDETGLPDLRPNYL